MKATFHPMNYLPPVSAIRLLAFIASFVCSLAPAAPVDHFEWAPLVSPQSAGQAFAVTISAMDTNQQVVTNFTGPVSLAGNVGSGFQSYPLLGDLSAQNSQVASFAVGYAFTPNADITITHVRAFSGGRVSIWSDKGLLLAAQELSDFGGRWVERSLLMPLKLQAATTYRVVLWSKGYRYYWRTSSVTSFAHGSIGPSYSASSDGFPTTTVSGVTWLVDLRYTVGSAASVAITPTTSGLFVDGVWTGSLTVQQGAKNMCLEASDGAGHAGDSGLFSVLAPGDVDLDLSAASAFAVKGDPIACQVVVTNTGPAAATSVTVTNLITGQAAVVSATASQGTCTVTGNQVVCALGSLAGGTAANATFWLMPTNTGLLAVHSTLTRGEADGSYDNNAAVMVAPIRDRPSVSVTDATVAEPDTNSTVAQLQVQLSYPTSQSVAVAYGTSNGIARAGIDYQAAAGTLVFAPGVTNLTLPLTVFGNRLCESNRTFYVNLSNTTNATIARSRAQITILDNDPLPGLSISDVSLVEGNRGTTNAVFVVSLTTPSGRTVTVDYLTTKGTATGGSDYTTKSGTLTFPPGLTTQTLSIPVLGDVIGETNETFFVFLINAVNASIVRAQAVGTIVNDDPETVCVNDSSVSEDTNALYAVFNVWVSPPTSQPVVVSYYTSDGTAVAGTDYLPASGALVFMPGVTTQSVTVVILGNFINETNQTFYLNLTNAMNAVIADAQGVCTILNNIPQPAVRVSSPAVLEGDDGQTNAVFQVSLSAASRQTLTVNYNTLDGSATAGSDYRAQGGILTFPPGTTNLSLSVPVLGDRLIESDEVFYLYANNARGVATIVNDDGLPGQPHHFEWSPIASPQVTGLVFTASITARDYYNGVATNFNGTATLLARTNSPTAVLFQEDFEDGNLDGWSPSNFAVDRYITNQFAAAGANCLYMGWNPTAHSLPNLTPSRINFYVRTDTASGYKGYFVVGNSSDASGAAAYFFMDASGRMGLYEDVGGFHAVPYSVNQWYKISLQFNWPARSIDYCVNDVLVQTNIPFRAPAVTNLTLVYLSSYTSCWWDQIEMLGTALVDAPGVLSTASVTFTNGLWTGPLAVSGVSTNVVLTATNSDGYVGFSNPFQVGYPDNLVVSMVPDRDFVFAGETVTYTVTANNTGPDALAGVSLADFLPVGMTFVSATASQGTWSVGGQTVTWAAGPLPATSNAVLRLVAQASVPGIVTNQVAGSFSGQDPNPADSAAMAVTQVLAPLHHFAFNTLTAPQQTRMPFLATVTARDLNNNLVSNFNGTVSLTASRLFTEDFEDGNFDGWDQAPGYGFGGPGTITTTNTYGGNNNVAVLTAGAGISHSFPNLTPSRLSFRVRMDTPGGDVFCTASSGGAESQRIVHFQLYAGAMNVYGANGTFSHPLAYTRWYQVAFVFHWPARTFDWYVDGVLAGANIAFYGGDANALSALDLFNWFASTSCWDDVQLLGDATAAVPVTPTSLASLTNGVWTGALTVQELATNVQLHVSDGQGHEGFSSTFTVGPGPHGVFDHFEWSAVGDHLVNQPFVATVTARDRFGDAVTDFTGSAVVREVQANAVRVLLFSAYSAATSIQGPLGILSNWVSNFVATTTTNTAPEALRADLRGQDVFVIASQTQAPSGSLAALPGQWADVLGEFVSRGGIVISLSSTAWVNDSGLLACAPRGAGGIFSLTKSTNHILTESVVTPFMAPSTLGYFFNTNGTKVLEVAAGGDPVVLSRDVGAGHALVFGSDLGWGFPSGTGLDRVFANAIKWAQSSGLSPLPDGVSTAGIFTNGVWSGTFVVSTLAPVAYLQTDDGHLKSAFSSPFAVGVVNDLAVSMTLSNPIAVVGQSLNFLLTVTNVGPQSATAVSLTNPLPPGLSLVSAISSQGTISLSGNNVVGDLGTLTNGQTAYITLTLLASLAGMVTNTVVVARAEPDFYAGNNSASVQATVFPPPSFSIGNATVLEGDSGLTNAVFRVTLFPPATQTAMVSYATWDISAVAGLDYIATNGVLVFPPGVTNLNLVVPVKGDLVSEDTETFLVRLSNPTNALLGASEGIGTIVDNNDPLPLLYVDSPVVLEGDSGTTSLTFHAFLAAPSGRTVWVRYATADGTASAGSDYDPASGLLQFNPGVTNLGFQVVVHGDTVNEPDEFLLVNLSSVTNAILAYPQTSGVILNDDAFPGKLDHFALGAPATALVEGQPFPLTITARDAWNTALPGANASLSVQCFRSGSSNAVEILSWTAYATASRYPVILSAISNGFTAFHETSTTTLDPTLLAGLLQGKDVFLVPAQSVPTGVMGALGTSWAAVLNRFVSAGGVVIVCSDNGDEHALLVNSGLLSLSRMSSSASGSVSIVTPSRLTDGVSNTFSAPYISTYAAGNGVVALKSIANNYATVIQRDVGAGSVFMFGSSFFSPGSPMDHVLANAVSWHHLAGDGTVPLSAPAPLLLDNGLWTGTVTVLQAGTNLALQVADASGHLGSLAPLTVLQDSDGDGLPDDWERANGLDPNNAADGLADSDGDGLSNLQEYQLGLNPRVSNRPYLYALPAATNPMSVRIEGLYGRSATLQVSTNLTDWQTLTNLPATSEAISFEDPEAAHSPQRFYRIVLP